MGQHELKDEIGEFLGLPKIPNCEGKEVAKVGFPHRPWRGAYVAHTVNITYSQW